MSDESKIEVIDENSNEIENEEDLNKKEISSEKSNYWNSAIKKIATHKVAYYIFKAILIRTLFIIQSSLYIYFLICQTDTLKILILVIPLFAIVLDGLYVCVQRKGIDYYWFSISTFSFTIVPTTCLWIANSQRKFSKHDCVNESAFHSTHPLCSYQPMSLCDFINLGTGTFLIFLVLAKWHLPFSIEKMSKTVHSYLLISLISSAADVIDLIEYVNNEKIVKAIGLNTLYAVTFVSLIQFSLTLTATKKIRIHLDKGIRFIIDILLGSEVWSILLVLVTQDLPYLIVRLVIMFKLGINVNATLYFFVLKNITLCIIDIYRIKSIIIEMEKEKHNKIHALNELGLKKF